MDALSVLLSSVTAQPAPCRLQSDDAWWSEASEILGEPGAVVVRAFSLELTARRVGRRLLFHGEILGAVEVPCGRCAEPYRHEFREPLELLLEPAPDGEAAPPGGIVLDPEDPALGRYAGDELDFGPVLVEILSLSWPMQPRCSESCLGLCPGCGRNLNSEGCGCETGGEERPFAGLEELLKQSRQRNG